MSTEYVMNDFRGGILSERMRRRTDMEGYFKSASLIENAVPMREGGLQQRPGCRIINAPANARRLITYTVSQEESIVICICPGRIFAYMEQDGILKSLDVAGFPVPYTEDEIQTIQYTQNHECMVLAHRKHTPYVIRKKEGVAGLSVAPIALKTSTDRVDSVDGKDVPFIWNYEGLFTEHDFPACCAFMSERLWFMSSDEHPYRLWASRPFDIFNFQDKDWYEYVSESMTAEQYLKAIEQYSSRSEDIAGDDTIYYKDTKQVSPEGFVVIEKGIAQKSDNAWLKTNDKRLTPQLIEKYGLKDDNGEVQNPRKETFFYTKPVTKWEKIDREDCSMELDVSSDRDERISWIGYAGGGMYVGTVSSEWLIPAGVNAINKAIQKINSYGSASFLQCTYGANALFYVQSGRKRIRAISSSNEGVSFSEPTYQASSLFESRDGVDRSIREMCWQRVPEPRLYLTLEDGTLAVLCYDTNYGISAWCKWTSSYSFKSATVRDTLHGQELVCLLEKDSNMYMGQFEDGLLSDGEFGFKPVVVTNSINTYATMSYNKGNYSVYIDSYNTRFKVACNDLTPREPYNMDYRSKDLASIPIPTNTSKDIRIRIEGFEKEQFNILALIVEVEAS